MSTEEKIARKTIRRPFTRMMKIFSILGSVFLMSASLFMVCLFVGLAQAADDGNVLKDNGLLVNGMTPAYGQVPGSADSWDMFDSGDQVFDCGTHVVECFDWNHKSVGTITNGACFIHWTFPPECESDDATDLNHCKDKYGKTIQYTKSLSSCLFR